ncbi:hypothetical protein [Thalassobellus suaedae]|uniref:Uncharacterized protein n=1 Tax=Thalassobellus suaedae TaxID=3074124 RepID=A0ABY9XS45_9FLAO|nr:hypothetical protein RHP51_16145 [Flavobacteriaceae bacterium HL-DH14]
MPSQSFFQYCEELLIKYKDDFRIWNIGGYKFPGLKGDDYSYTFSRYPHIWGWATWADRWKSYDVEIKNFKDNRDIIFQYEYFKESYQNNHIGKILDNVVSGGIDTWDYQWGFTLRSNNALSIRPKKNLVSNIGFGTDDATHTKSINKEIEDNLAEELDLPLKHPDFVMVYNIDDQIFEKKYRDFRFLSKLKRKINNLF